MFRRVLPLSGGVAEAVLRDRKKAPLKKEQNLPRESLGDHGDNWVSIAEQWNGDLFVFFQRRPHQRHFQKAAKQTAYIAEFLSCRIGIGLLLVATFTLLCAASAA